MCGMPIDMPSVPRVCAVIVSYHPDLEQTERQLALLRPQVDFAVCVDNSNDAAVRGKLAELGERYNMQVLALADNLGIAAAHNAGIACARRVEATHVLLLDQDSVPAADMVARLLAASQALSERGRDVAAVGPAVVDGHDAAPGAALVAVDVLISSGMLIGLTAIDRLGAMDETLFIDQVDNDWCLRARAAGASCYVVGGARMAHSLGGRTLRLWLLRWYRLPVHSPQRHYFNFRNSIRLYRRPYVPATWVARDIVRLLKVLLCFSIIGRHRRRHLGMMLRGIKDGWRDLGGNPFPGQHLSGDGGADA